MAVWGSSAPNPLSSPPVSAGPTGSALWDFIVPGTDPSAEQYVPRLVDRKNFSHLQVLSIYTFDEKGARQLTDYWCDICSIPMYEIKECECCQGPIRLRFQPKELPTDLNPDASKPDRKQ